MPNYLSGDLCLTLPMLHPMQQVINDDPRRFKVLSCGRRFGKTLFGIHRILGCIMQNRPFGWFAATIKLMDQAWRDICKTLAPIIERANDQKKFIKFRSDLFGADAWLEGWSFEGEGEGRSRKFGEIFVDEVGLIPNIKKIYSESLRWCLADFEAPAIFAGTPRGRGDFYDLWIRGELDDWPEWASWKLRGDCNPLPSIRREYKLMEKELSERTFAQEGCGEFLDDAGGVFRNVRVCSTEERAEYQPGHEYFAGVDWGRSNDFSVISVWDLTQRRQVDLDRYNQVEYHLQRERIKATFEKWHLDESNIYAESNSIGYSNIEELTKDGYPVTPFLMRNDKKAKMVDEFAAALERKNIHLLNDPIQVDELESFESSKTETGLYKYGAPVGRHDDTVIANLIAFHALKSRDFSDLTDSSTVGKSPEKVELDAYNAEWVERMKSLREQTFPPDAVDDFLNEGVYA